MNPWFSLEWLRQWYEAGPTNPKQKSNHRDRNWSFGDVVVQAPTRSEAKAKLKAVLHRKRLSVKQVKDLFQEA